MLNENCCEIQKEICCDDKHSLFNVSVYYGRGSCCGNGTGNSSEEGASINDHNALENRNLGIQHDAGSIGFADGETLQEKYDKGELGGSYLVCHGIFDSNVVNGSVWNTLTPVYIGGENIISGGGLVIPRDGTYLLSAYTGDTTPGTNPFFSIWKNGASIAPNRNQSTAGGAISTCAVKLAKDDFLEFKFTTSINETVTLSSTRSYFNLISI